MKTYLKIIITSFLLLGCSAATVERSLSNERSVVVKQHFSSINFPEITNVANNWCSFYKSSTKLTSSTQGCLLCGSEYSYYYFDCIGSQTNNISLPISYPSTHKTNELPDQAAKNQLPSNLQTINLNRAKEQCISIGLKEKTEKFGDCVLKLSR